MLSENSKKIRILMVEDDIELCEGWADIFDLIGHDLRYYTCGNAMLHDVSAIHNADLLISDFYLPDLNGVEVIEAATAIKPSLRTILLTGSRESLILESATKLNGCSILHKPANIEDIEKKISEYFH